MAVVGHETHSPVVTLAVIYNVGARHESDADAGLTHCLRMAVNQVLFTMELTGVDSFLLYKAHNVSVYFVRKPAKFGTVIHHGEKVGSFPLGPLYS